MVILGIETATERLSAALSIDSSIDERHSDVRSSHCECLAGFIESLTEDAGISVSDIDGIAVSLGPGSFTGLRIGIATAMGLAYGLCVLTAGIGTLAALAWKSGTPGTLVCPLIDARRREAYTALYRLRENETPEEVMAPGTIPVNKLGKLLTSHDEEILVTGPASHLFFEALSSNHTGLTLLPEEQIKPSAISVAEMGALLFDAGSAMPPSELTPLYLRRADAELCRK